MHLDVMRGIVAEIVSQAVSSEEVLYMLENRLEEAEVTLRTDIRILLNEFRHLSTKRQPSR
jgi:hypothetical protein